MTGAWRLMPQGRLFHAVSMRAVEKMELAIPIALRMAERYLVLLTTERSAPGYEKLAPELRWLNQFICPTPIR